MAAAPVTGDDLTAHASIDSVGARDGFAYTNSTGVDRVAYALAGGANATPWCPWPLDLAFVVSDSGFGVLDYYSGGAGNCPLAEDLPFPAGGTLYIEVLDEGDDDIADYELLVGSWIP